MEEIFGIPYRTVKQDRKTLRVRVDTSGNVTVFAPKNASSKTVRDFLTKYEAWLKETTASKRTESDNSLFGGDPQKPQLLYLGKAYPVEFTAADARSSRFDGARFVLPSALTANQYRVVITEIYRSLSKQYIPKLLNEICEQHHIVYNSVHIRTSTSRWGSCSSKKALNFSVYLIVASEDCIRHIICHELAHLREMNHSPNFYKRLAELEPTHREQQIKLSSRYGSILHSFRRSSEIR